MNNLIKYFKFKNLLIFMKVIAASIVAFSTSMALAILFDEFDIINSPSDRELIIFLTSVSLFFIILPMIFRKAESFDDTVISYEAFIQINQARASRLISVALLLIFGITAVVFAARAVSYATSDLQSAGISSNLQQTYDLTASLIASLNEKYNSEILSRSNEDVKDYEFRLARLLETQTALGEEIRLARSASEMVNVDGTVKQIFLFQFFSSLFVRLGTLGVILILFGVTLRQYRRYEKQILELRQLNLSLKLTREGIDPQLLTAVRAVTHISEDAKDGDKNELDTAFSSAYSSFMNSAMESLKKKLE